MESALALPPLCLFDNSRLTFWHRIGAEAGTSYPYWALDAGVVELSQNNGATWKIISPTVIYPSRASPYNTIFLAAYQRCYSGSFDWKMDVSSGILAIVDGYRALTPNPCSLPIQQIAVFP